MLDGRESDVTRLRISPGVVPDGVEHDGLKNGLLVLPAFARQDCFSH